MMFEQFTKEARAAVTAAQDIAREASTRTIDTRHLLVALASNPGPARDALEVTGVDPTALAANTMMALTTDGLDPEALAGLGIDLEAVRREADKTFGTGALDRAARRPGKHIPFTTDAKKALELSLREAMRLKQKRIDGGHLLLGIVRAACPARTTLLDAGVDTDALRVALEGQPRAA